MLIEESPLEYPQSVLSRQWKGGDTDEQEFLVFFPDFRKVFSTSLTIFENSQNSILEATVASRKSLISDCIISDKCN